MVSKNGPDELIQQNVADSLDGPWEMVAEGIGRGMPAGEGPLVFRDNVDREKWYLWIDDYLRGGGYLPFETNDLASGKWTASEKFRLPENPRHGYVVSITAAEQERLLAAWN
ncbi:hypothetical protein MFIFM68171_07271 [Madurella fahalii]|uniref:Uncharacterized protein n=1 Tax=Madurella fahalii TaxID=1157608 RepID=A0ABQ0GH29_9PEZI